MLNQNTMSIIKIILKNTIIISDTKYNLYTIIADHVTYSQSRT